MIGDELALDGNPSMNLHLSVTMYMEREAEELMIEGLRKNYIDLDQYPQTASPQPLRANARKLVSCPSMKAEGYRYGCIGSSEAIMLAGLAMKRKWKDRRIAAGSFYEKPANMVFVFKRPGFWRRPMCFLE
ncbi:glutamate decarboxylase [Phytophthora cinnamomi]|uniref:glutamate decarboxylase n=1 Tax=Phytophthora cinnamomi TaxID=4785 RepID=UPI00355AC82C|nr:glutamate decarboxylase [Phytophthora cinnamomi]